MERVFAVDFDGTIHNANSYAPGHKMGTPFPGAKQALDRMVEAHVAPVIFTVRGDHQYLRDWLNYFQIPFAGITNVKLKEFVRIIDDRALQFRGDWNETMRELGFQ